MEDRSVNSTERIPGGRAEGMTIEDIAKKHGVSISLIKSQITKGTKVEHEHSPDDAVAAEIAMDHLTEHPLYYDYLEEMEATFEKNYKKDIEKASDSLKEERLRQLFG